VNAHTGLSANRYAQGFENLIENSAEKINKKM
jgi:hypothetical protein